MSRFRLWLSRGLTGLAVVGVAWASFDLSKRLASEELVLRLEWLAPALVGLLCGYAAMCWFFVGFVRRHTRGSPGLWSMVELYLRSLLARYVPGKVLVPAMRMAAADGMAMPAVLLGAGVMLEGIAWLSMGALTCFALGLSMPGQLAGLLGVSRPWLWGALAAALTFLVLAATVDLERYPTKLRKLMGMQVAKGPLVPARLLVASAILWLGTAVSSAFVAEALGGQGGAANLAAFATVAASLVGFLALPVPAGLGVREAAFVMIVAPAMGERWAIAAGLIARALAIFAECALWLVSLVARAVQQNRSELPERPSIP